MTKQRKEFTLEPESIEYLKGLPARTASKKIDEAITLLKIKESNPEVEQNEPENEKGAIVNEVRVRI